MTELSEQIIALRNQGMTYKQIQKELRCSKGTISYYLSPGGVEKRRAVQRAARDRNSELIKRLKESTPCADCGQYFPSYVMDFDHLKDKGFGIARYRSKCVSEKTLKSEMAKCEIVCSNCHRVRTHKRKQ